MALQRATRFSTGGWDDAVPERVDAQCGYCGKAVAMERIGRVIEFAQQHGMAPGSQDMGVHTTYVCPREQCLKPSIAFFWLRRDHHGDTYISEGPTFIPRGQPQPKEGLPDEIQEDRREAWSCYYGGDYRAAIIMGRASIQRAVRQLKGKGAGLKAEINDLAQRHKITDALRDAAHEVRISGDDAAHPEDLGVVTEDEAKDSLEFMDDFLEHAVAMPAKAEARKQARKQQT